LTPKPCSRVGHEKGCPATSISEKQYLALNWLGKEFSTFLKSSVPALDRALPPPLPNAERSHQPNPVSASQRANHFDENASLSASGSDLTPTRKSNRDSLEWTLFCLRSTNSSMHIGED
jgi:hypothetical protein